MNSQNNYNGIPGQMQMNPQMGQTQMNPQMGQMQMNPQMGQMQMNPQMGTLTTEQSQIPIEISDQGVLAYKQSLRTMPEVQNLTSEIEVQNPNSIILFGQ